MPSTKNSKKVAVLAAVGAAVLADIPKEKNGLVQAVREDTVEQTHISWVRFVLLATMIFLLIVVLALTYRFCCWNKRRRVSSYLLLLAVL
jgi:heme/copper-type cytochrome/quinol oxidase subunit 2